MNAIVIWNGNQKNSNDWESYGRAKSIKVFVNNKPMYIHNLEDSSHKQVFEVEKLESIHIDKDLLLTFEFLDSYPGIDFNILSISEINFDGKSH